jgi:uncharacterized protein
MPSADPITTALLSHSACKRPSGAAFRPVTSLARYLLLLSAVLAALSVRADMESAKAAYDRKDYAAAFSEFHSLAQAGDANAQASLGVLYELGRGAEKDYVKAVEWYPKSAERGNDNGQYNLGTMYYFGKGVPEDMMYSCMWFAIAAQSNHGAARNSIQLCLKKLDDAGRADYERRVQEWLAAHKK